MSDGKWDAWNDAELRAILAQQLPQYGARRPDVHEPNPYGRYRVQGRAWRDERYNPRSGHMDTITVVEIGGEDDA